MEASRTETGANTEEYSPFNSYSGTRSIAITSGKGGVGKTSTAVNLALYFAAEGMRTAILDLDPLADVCAYLDMQAPEGALDATDISPEYPLESYTISAFANLDVVFPGLKLSRGASGHLRSMLTATYRRSLETNYDILVLDLPAGNEEETNLSFVDLADTILLVTNPEPTAHMSAGGWCRALFESRPDRAVFVWHNKFARGGPDGFNPKAVIKNYNRNSPPESQISDEYAARIADLAWVPEDPALSMLQSGIPDPQAICLRSMQRLSAQIAEDRATTLLRERGMKSALRSFTVEVLGRDHAPTEDAAELVSEVELLAVDTLGSEVGAKVATLARIMRNDRSLSLLGEDKRNRVKDAIQSVRADRLWKSAARARERCAFGAAKAHERNSLFSSVSQDSFDHVMNGVDEAVRELLRIASGVPATIRRGARDKAAAAEKRAATENTAAAETSGATENTAAAEKAGATENTAAAEKSGATENTAAGGNTTPTNNSGASQQAEAELEAISESRASVRRNAQVLLFYLAFFKLVRNNSVLRRLTKTIPRRREGRRVYRDRKQQIRYLVEGDETYRRQYVAVIRSLFPVLTRQVATLAHALGVDALLIRRSGTVEKRAYLTLFSNAVHDCLFSGLGIMTGFKYRETSRAFSDAAEDLKQRLFPA